LWIGFHQWLRAQGVITQGWLPQRWRAELTQLRTAADRFMLRKVQAAALLRWRGHHIPPADTL
jgi:hypothetical protein